MPQRDTSVIVDASVERAYECWRSPRKVAGFVSGIEKVSTVGRNGERWRVLGVSGEVSELEVREDALGRRISWKVAGDSDGGELSVMFEELWPERTRVHVEESRALPGCAAVGEGDLETFKSLVESEELPELERDEGRVRRDLISASAGSLLTFGAFALILALRRMRGAGHV